MNGLAQFLTFAGCFLKRAFRIAAFGTFMLVLLPAAQIAAHEDHDEEVPHAIPWPDDKNVAFAYSADSSNEFFSSYDAVWAAMQPLYKGTKRDKDSKNPISPIIMHTEFDLNNDGLPETIAYHVEAEDEKGKFCKTDGLCPFYVIDFSDEKPRIISVINARSIDRGNDVKNGYWTLKAFNSLKDFDSFQTYEFEPKNGRYGPVREP